MKFKIIHILILLTLSIPAFGQPVVMWQNHFGGKSFEQPFSTEFTKDKGLLIGGHSNSTGNDLDTNYGDYDWWLIKLDSTGKKVWSEVYGGSLYDKCRYAHENNDGTIISFGSVESNDIDVSGNHGNNDLWLLKTDSAGNKIWSRCYGGSKGDAGRMVIENFDGNYISVAYVLSEDGDVNNKYGGYDGWVFETDADSGNIIWSMNYGGNKEERIRRITQWPDSNYVFAGNANSINFDLSGTVNYGGEDFWITRIDKQGGVIWSVQYGGPGDDRIYGLVRDVDGHIVVCGKNEGAGGNISFSYGNEDVWVCKINYIDGSLIWEKSLGGTQDDVADKIDVMPDGSYLITATTESSDGDLNSHYGNADGWIINLDTNRNIIWSKVIGGTGDEHIYDTYFNSDSSLWVVGFSNSDSLYGEIAGIIGGYDLWVAKLAWCDSSGQISASGPVSFCPGNVVDLTAPDADAYLWSTGVSLQTISAFNPSVYSVTVSRGYECTFHPYPVTVMHYPLPAVPVISTNGATLTATLASAYQWYLNGQPLAGANQQSVVASWPGSYYVEVFDTNGCSSLSMPLAMTSVVETDQPASLLYPNPYTGGGLLQFRLYKPHTAFTRIEITDVTGSILFSTNNFRISGDVVSVEPPPFSNGVYFLCLRDTNHYIVRIPLMIVR